MFVKARQPKWWGMYGIGVLFLGSLIGEARLSVPTAVHQILEIGLVLAGFGLMWLWIGANRLALLQEPPRQELREPILRGIVEQAPKQLPAAAQPQPTAEPSQAAGQIGSGPAQRPVQVPASNGHHAPGAGKLAIWSLTSKRRSG